MAAVAPIALALHGPLPGEEVAEDATSAEELRQAALESVASICRARRRALPVLLSTTQASASLVDQAQEAARVTGRLAEQLRAGGKLQPQHVPAYLPHGLSTTFLEDFAGTGTREDTIRKFAAISVVKAVTGDSYVDAAIRLGHDPKPIPTLAGNLVNRLTKAGTSDSYRQHVRSAVNALATATPVVDYAARRRVLRGLKKVPREVIQQGGVQVTEARRTNAAAWLWAELTGGHVHEAPCWGRAGPSEAQKEVFRRFRRDVLPKVRASVTQYGELLVAPGAERDDGNGI